MCDHRHLRSPPPAGIVDHVSFLSDNLGELVENSDYSDITLVVENVPFPAHKVILATRSEYFRYKNELKILLILNYCVIMHDCKDYFGLHICSVREKKEKLMEVIFSKISPCVRIFEIYMNHIPLYG